MNFLSNLILLINFFFLYFFLLLYQTNLFGEELKTHFAKDTIVVTADRQNKSILETNASVSILNQEKIRQIEPSSMHESLLSVSGVFMQKTNHGGGSPFVRGLTGQQVLILVDGIRLNNSITRSGPNQYLNTIDINIIDKIEVLKGQGSVEFGSDAIGGIINLITKKPLFAKNNQFLINTDVYGRYVTDNMEKTGYAGVNLAYSNVALLGTFAYTDFGDVIAANNFRQTPSNYKQFNANGMLRYKVSENVELTASSQFTKQSKVPLFHKVTLENFEYNYFDPQLRNFNYINLKGVSSLKFFNIYSFTLFNNNTEEGRYQKKNNSSTKRIEKDNLNNYGFTGNLLSTIYHFWSTNTGFELYYDVVRSKRTDQNLTTNEITEKRGLYPDNSTFQNFAVFNFHTLTYNNFMLNLGWRYDNVSINVPEKSLGTIRINTDALVWKIGLSRKLFDNQTIGININKAFRAPNIDDMGTLGIVDFRYEIPSNDLKPEVSINYEINYKYISEALWFEASIFRNNLKDFIQRVKGTINGKDSIDGYPVFLKKNTAEAFIHGVELFTKYNYQNIVSIESFVSYTYGQDITANDPMRRIPPLNGLLAVDYVLFSDFRIRSEILFASKQDRLAKADKSDNRIPSGGTPGWKVFNVYLNYYYKFFKFNIGLLNIFDEKYRYHGSGIDMGGRNAKLTATFLI